MGLGYMTIIAYFCTIHLIQMSKRLLHSLLFCCTALVWLAGSWGFARVAEQAEGQIGQQAQLYAGEDAARFAQEMRGALRDAAACVRTEGQQQGSKLPRPHLLWTGLCAEALHTAPLAAWGHKGLAYGPGCGHGLFPAVHLISLRI